MSDRAIIEAINKMTGQHRVDQVTYVDAIVDSVDVQSRSCSCTAIFGNSEYELPTVKLMASTDDGLLIVPAINSNVKVIFSQNLEPFVCQYSEIESVILDANTSIQFCDGSFGGLVKIDAVFKLAQNVYADLKQISTALNTLGVPIQQQTGLPDKKDFENDKIKHGI